MVKMRRAGLVAALGLLVSAGTWLPGASPGPLRTSVPGGPIGYSAHVLGQPDPARYTALIEDGGATSLRTDVSWASVQTTRAGFNWSGPDEIVTQAASHHLNVLMIVDSTPAWASGASTSRSDWSWLPPHRPADYGAFAAAVAARYGGGGTFWQEHPHLPQYPPAGIELWNEENTSRFWGNEVPSPLVYAAMVKAAYTSIKRVDPAMTVLIGGLAPVGGYNVVTCSDRNGPGHDNTAWNGLNYLQALYAAGVHGYFDAVAWHAYNYWRGATAAGMLSYNYCSAWSQMASTPVSVRSLMDSHGDAGKRIWITETGAPTCVPGAAYICVSPVQQADLAARETRLWKSFPWAGGFYWYDIRDDPGAVTNVESHFGAVSSNNAPKLAYIALKDAWRVCFGVERHSVPGWRVPSPRCGGRLWPRRIVPARTPFRASGRRRRGRTGLREYVLGCENTSPQTGWGVPCVEDAPEGRRAHEPCRKVLKRCTLAGAQSAGITDKIA